MLIKQEYSFHKISCCGLIIVVRGYLKLYKSECIAI